MDGQRKKLLLRKKANCVVTMMTILLSGFMLGVAGSLHCVGMCGPLSLALPTWQLNKWMKLVSLFAYQLGRIITYTVIGIVAGLAGRGLHIAGLQQWFSISTGIFILLLAALYYFRGRMGNAPLLVKFYGTLSVTMGKLIANNTGIAGFLLLGMANGLLPCGMVYMALAAAISFHSVTQSAAFMALFGAGTLPAMMLIGYSVNIFSMPVRRVMKQSMPYLIMLTGIVLILRGFNLGIPFISPQLHPVANQMINCHR